MFKFIQCTLFQSATDTLRITLQIDAEIKFSNELKKTPKNVKWFLVKNHNFNKILFNI